jgi:hypothetical protein
MILFQNNCFLFTSLYCPLLSSPFLNNKNNLRLGVVAHTCHLNYKGGRDQKGCGPASTKSEGEQISTNKLGWSHMPIISAMWKIEVGGLWSKSNPGHKLETLFEKQTKGKELNIWHNW